MYYIIAQNYLPASPLSRAPDRANVVYAAEVGDFQIRARPGFPSRCCIRTLGSSRLRCREREMVPHASISCHECYFTWQRAPGQCDGQSIQGPYRKESVGLHSRDTSLLALKMGDGAMSLGVQVAFRS